MGIWGFRGFELGGVSEDALPSESVWLLHA